MFYGLTSSVRHKIVPTVRYFENLRQKQNRASFLTQENKTHVRRNKSKNYHQVNPRKIMTSEENSPRCDDCEEENCIFSTLWEDVQKELDVWLLIEDGPPMVNHIRNKAYGIFSRLIYGYLGSGVRVKLPPCVVQGVRDAYPSTDGMYKGFQISKSINDVN